MPDDLNERAARLSREFLSRKVDVPAAHFDRLASPVASFAVITTVDEGGRVNAAPVATCLRNNHFPTCFEFTMDARRHTSENVHSTAEFVVNIVPFDREVLEIAASVDRDFVDDQGFVVHARLRTVQHAGRSTGPSSSAVRK